MENSLMPPAESQNIRLLCLVCGKEAQHWRELVEHWLDNHETEYQERRRVEK